MFENTHAPTHPFPPGLGANHTVSRNNNSQQLLLETGWGHVGKCSDPLPGVAVWMGPFLGQIEGFPAWHPQRPGSQCSPAGATLMDSRVAGPDHSRRPEGLKSSSDLLGLGLCWWRHVHWPKNGRKKEGSNLKVKVPSEYVFLVFFLQDSPHQAWIRLEWVATPIVAF